MRVAIGGTTFLCQCHVPPLLPIRNAECDMAHARTHPAPLLHCFLVTGRLPNPPSWATIRSPRASPPQRIGSSRVRGRGGELGTIKNLNL